MYFAELVKYINDSTQTEMMFLHLENSNYLNSTNLEVMHISAYASIRFIHQLLLKNILHVFWEINSMRTVKS